MRRHRLGSWRCASGNKVDIYLRADDGSGVRQLEAEWDSPPPLSDSDFADYVAIILPTLTKRAQEYLERPGKALVVVA